MSDDYPLPKVYLNEPDEAAPDGGAIFWLVIILAGASFACLIVGGLVQLALAVTQ